MSRNVYKYPESFGDCGEYMTESDFNTMAQWPCMRVWYDEAVANGTFEGSFETYVETQQDLCELVVLE